MEPEEGALIEEVAEGGGVAPSEEQIALEIEDEEAPVIGAEEEAVGDVALTQVPPLADLFGEEGRALDGAGGGPGIEGVMLGEGDGVAEGDGTEVEGPDPALLVDGIDLEVKIGKAGIDGKDAGLGEGVDVGEDTLAWGIGREGEEETGGPAGKEGSDWEKEAKGPDAFAAEGCFGRRRGSGSWCVRQSWFWCRFR